MPTLSSNDYRVGLRRMGYITCKACDGFGKIGDRFTHQFKPCPACQATGMIFPTDAERIAALERRLNESEGGK